MKKLIYNSAILLLTGAVLLISSCTKHDEQNGGPIVKGSAKDKQIRDLIRRLPVEKLVYERAANANTTKGKGGENSTFSTWNFAFPGGGISFSNGHAGTITITNGPTVFIIATNSFGANTGGGVVVAGETSLEINYTFCFSSEDDALGLGLFNGLTFDGVSSVVGVAGDFEALADATDSTDFSDIFHGLAFYIVYDATASGNYEILDWLNDDLDDSTNTEDKAFAFIFDFVNGRLFVSKNGSINVDGGSMNFQGNYLEVSGFIDENGDLDLNGELEYRIVPGFGAMGCN